MTERNHSEKLTSHLSVKGGTKFVTYAVVGSLVYLLVYFNTGGKLNIDRMQAYQANGGHITASSVSNEVSAVTEAVSGEELVTEERWVQGERYEGKIIWIGDSRTYCLQGTGDVYHLFDPSNDIWECAGGSDYNSTNPPGFLAHLPSIKSDLQANPDAAVVLHYGLNDIATYLCGGHQTNNAKNYNKEIKKLKDQFPNARFYFASVTPVSGDYPSTGYHGGPVPKSVLMKEIKKYNKWMKENSCMQFIDTFQAYVDANSYPTTDHLHYYGQENMLLYNTVRDHINDHMETVTVSANGGNGSSNANSADNARLKAMSDAEKQAYITPNSSGALIRDGASKDSESSCEAMMVDVQVKIRNYQGQTKMVTLKVHNKLKNNIKDIFDEIYNTTTFTIDENAFYCYKYRDISGTTKASLHSYGCAIDINFWHNGYPDLAQGERVEACTVCGHDVSNDNIHIRTKEHPVVKIFEKYGWGWAYAGYPECRPYPDLMHFSFLEGQ